MYFTYYMLGIILLPGLIFAAYAQTKVTSNFNKYKQVNYSQMTPVYQKARFFLDAMGLTDVQVARVSGHLTDNYNPKTNTVSLSDEVYNSTSIASLGIACHEIGHVLQHKQGYGLIKLRSILIPIINIGSFLMWPLVILGLILEFTQYFTTGNVLIIIGIVIFGLSVLFSALTLPIEKDASRRAYKMLVETGELTQEEGEGVKAVLNAAALTYVASLLVSVLSFIRFVLAISLSRRRD
ncbi:MAG: zinc metallopeptidase [Clostridia bacterium]|nr:zinc metallopeptidase [Clostridia bacterium]